ncbi:MAG: hypothetical protein AB8I08_13630 [Sandaracinaceae bacterium]
MDMDVSLLPHLSEEAVRDEARRRGLDTDGKSRDALIEAIRASEAGAVGKVKGLFGRVARLAKAAIESRAPSQPPPPMRASQPAAPPEPIATLTMAKVLLTQGHLERAHTILQDLDANDPEVVAALREATERRRQSRLESLAHGLSEREAPFVAIARDGDLSGLVWNVDDDALARGQALLGKDGQLTLRVVSVVAHPDHHVESIRADQPVGRRGHQPLESSAERVVVSVGLAADQRFVSLAHAAR